jgi:hypothetical protein
MENCYNPFHNLLISDNAYADDKQFEILTLREN